MGNCSNIANFVEKLHMNLGICILVMQTMVVLAIRVIAIGRSCKRPTCYACSLSISLRTCEEDFARHRQLFLTEQGYSYQIRVID